VADVGVEAFKHNLWANLRLLDACASLSEDDLAAAAVGTYGTVRDTLVHLVAAEGRYVGEFNAPTEGMLSEDAPFVGFEKLRLYAEASGQSLLDIASSQPAERVLNGTYRGTPYEMPASILLVHAINHSTEHRGHVISILSPRGVATGPAWRLDGIGYFQAGAHA
jgi:uncharacterized damage-inducible protein DinB